MISRFITAARVSELIGRSEKRCLALMKAGRIRSKCENRRWYTTEAAVEAYQSSPDVEQPPTETHATRPWGVLRSRRQPQAEATGRMETRAEYNARTKAEGRYVRDF